MEDIARFKHFFREMGVTGDVWSADGIHPIKDTHTVIGVAQALFCFNADGRFIGTACDENGGRQLRKESK